MFVLCSSVLDLMTLSDTPTSFTYHTERCPSILMLSQTEPVIPLILTKLRHDIILYLCDFLDATSILNFGLTCKKSHQLINENEPYWKLRYYKEFALDDD
jgi:hypothetical protein